MFFDKEIEMKSLNQFLMFGMLVFFASAMVFSDETRVEFYGVKLQDASYDTGNNLYAMLNTYLGLEGDEKYSSSIDIFNERGVDPTTQWITSGSGLLHAFNKSSLWHQLNVLSSEGETICEMYDAGEHYVSGRYDLPDGVNLDFQMLPYWPLTAENNTYDYIWSWYSDPLKNAASGEPTYFRGDLLNPGDGEIHMLAFDITDLYNMKNGTLFDSVYMFGWEDLPADQDSWVKADFDYNDMVVIMTNLTPTVATPEPATLLIILAGGGLVSARYLRRKNNCKNNIGL
jgi:hypothetical protein